MTYLALTRTDRIRAAVIGGGMSDAFDPVARRPEMDTGQFAEVSPGYARHKDAALRARSPVRWPERRHKSTPLLRLHGSADGRVHPTQALAMASALYARPHPFRCVFFEGGITNDASTERRWRHWSRRGWIATRATARPGPASNRTGDENIAIVPVRRGELTHLGAMSPPAIHWRGKRSHPWRRCAALACCGAGRNRHLSKR